MLLRMLAVGRIDPGRFVPHRFALDEMAAHDVFSRLRESGTWKVVLSR